VIEKTIIFHVPALDAAVRGGIVSELIAEKRRDFGNDTSISIPEMKNLGSEGT
jgi:hypothetical protein